MSRHVIRCREGMPEFDVRWPWTASTQLGPGLTAVLRAKNEAHNLPSVLPALLSAVDHVVLVDNGSTDGTAGVGQEVAARLGVEDRLTSATYPFEVSRCGPEHLRTPPDSVHSLVHFYNWAFAHVRTRYSLKWDGDMVLTPEGVVALSGLSWQLDTARTLVSFAHFPLYVESPSVGYFDAALRNMEAWIHPMSPEFTYVKGFDWEIRSAPRQVRRTTLPEGLCFELKWLDRDEFDHWTDESALHSGRSPRKSREYQVFTALRDGTGHDLEHVHRIEAPPGVHIVDHVRTHWLPRRPRPLSGLDQ